MTRIRCFFLLLAAVVCLSHAQSAMTISVHGSGTTNPAQCYWHIMEKFQTQSKLPVRMTYRAVGSSTGQVEFFGDGTVSDNDFGSGDIPLNTNVFESFPAGSVLHFPVLLGSHGFYHSLPVEKLFLTSCLLARIFNRDITDWNHPDILALNPNLSLPNPYPITVARRALGSSTTAMITLFLQKTCPNNWPESLVGNIIEWPQDTLSCQGSGGMVDCIRANPGTIGYLASASAPQDGTITELLVQNANGNFLTSEEARLSGGILAATASAGVPNSFDSSFANVDLVNQPGPSTWPMVSMTYLYVRKDLTFLDGPGRQTLLKAFLRALYTDSYVAACEEEMGFVPITGPLRDTALSTIDSLVTSAGAPEWTFEFNTERRLGQGDFVISTKRGTYSDVVQQNLVSSVHTIEAELAALDIGQVPGATSSPVSVPADPAAQEQIDSLKQEVATLTAQYDASARNIQSLQFEVDTLLEKNEEMSQLIDSLVAGITNMTTSSEAVMRRVEELESMVDDHSHSGSVTSFGLTTIMLWIQAALFSYCSLLVCWV